MNYRHAYHAGNFADVLKHSVLALVIAALKRKDTPFRVIDTHAGRGQYMLASTEAKKTSEWRGGIGRLLGRTAKPLSPEIAGLLSPYLDAVRAENADGRMSVYPGSPVLAYRLIRAQDTLVANELHPEERAQLKTLVGSDRRVKLMGLDAWVAVRALLPPKERRGVILIDPPFEAPDELDRLAKGLAEGLERFATGIFLAWYPIKDLKPIATLYDALAALPGAALLRVELLVRPTSDPDRLNGCGLVVVNPPFMLEDNLRAVLPKLTLLLADAAGARYRLERIAPISTARAAGSQPAPNRRLR